MCVRPAAFNITKLFSMVSAVHICSNSSIEKISREKGLREKKIIFKHPKPNEAL